MYLAVLGMDEEELVGGRYRIESELGRGGMAVAYSATDTVHGTSVALKRLLPHASTGSALQRFEREFHTLQQLSHPRVVQVHDFAHEAAGSAYYTMEWLGGSDLNELAPLPYRRVCALLSDVASALSLLHSRHLVHRDVTPRNIRCGDDGHAKLLDFGAIVPFGVAPSLVGTPACCACEAVTGQDLDGRADLFSLGATAYLALTGRQAYPATRFEQLQDLWRSPLRAPSAFAPDVPKALDALVMSLLSRDRMARPATAAEVMERLCAIGELDVSEQVVVQQAYLTSPRLVGREAQLRQLRAHLIRSQPADGPALLVQGEPGMGRSRFAATCVLEAKLMGAVVARANAGDVMGAFGVARALAGQLAEALPQAVEALAPSQRARLFATEASGGATETATETGAGTPEAGPQAAALLSLFNSFMLGAAEHRQIVLVVDDAHRLDERSAALLSMLSDSASGHDLTLIATVASDERPDGGPLSVFASAAKVIEMGPISADETNALLASIFGDVAHLALLSGHLHATSAGCPGTLMALAQHLLDRGTVRYEAGAWTLPAKIDPSDIPSSIEAALSNKIEGLSSEALRLAQGLSLARQGISLGELVDFMGAEGPGVALAAMDELISAGIAKVADVRYRIARPSHRAVLQSSLAPGVAADLHSRLAALYGSRAQHSWHMVQHLCLAGRKDEAIDAILRQPLVVTDTAVASARARELSDDWQVHFRDLIQHAQEQGRCASDRYHLLNALVTYALMRGEARRADVEAILRQVEHACGRDLYETLDPQLPAAERIGQMFTLAQARYDALPEQERVMSPADALPELGRVVLRAIGALGSHYERNFFSELRALEPLACLSPALQVIQWNVEATSHLNAGRYLPAIDLNGRMLARMAEPDAAGLDPVACRYMSLALKFSGGLSRTILGLDIPPEHLTDLDADPVFAINACHVRMLDALSRGDIREADSQRHAADLLRLQDNPPQMFDGVFHSREATLFAFAGDLARLKQVLPHIAQRARKIPGWRPIHHHAMGNYHLLRGDPQAALVQLEAGRALVRAGEHPYFSELAATRARALIELDRASEALEPGLADLEAARDADLGPCMNVLSQAMALVHAAVGDHERARALADEAVDALTELGAQGVSLGAAHETRARVAVAAGDYGAFKDHAERCGVIYQAGRNPLLTARHATLMSQESARRLALCDESVRELLPAMDDTLQDVFATQCGEPGERVRAALEALVTCMGGRVGWLYIPGPSGATLAAEVGGATPPPGMAHRVAEQLTLELDGIGDDMQTCATDLDGSQVSGFQPSAGGASEYQPLTVSHEQDGEPVVTGIVVVPWHASWTPPPASLVTAVSLVLDQPSDSDTQLAG